MKSVNQGYNKYCVPAVLSILTGRSTDDCASVVGSFISKYDIQEVPVDVMISAAGKLRWNLIEQSSLENASIFWAFNSLYNRPGMYVFLIKKHVVAVEVTENKQIFLCDNHSKEPINGHSSARLGQIVLKIWKAEPKPPAILIREYYDIQLTAHGAYIHKISEFQDSTDNIKRNMGFLHGTQDELNLASQALVNKIADSTK